MITEHELQISNMSYTEKDFQSIYPALLTLARQLTNRWDPASSNESDPGNVLLKLAAVIGDKTNYNIDKNVLECFLPSATQETSMRMLTDALGYNMKYYQSAVVNILFKYTGDLGGSTITLPRFSTVISNSDSTVYYTLVDDVKIALSNFSVEGKAIEGSLSTLLVGNNEIIKLENLDDNNRLYFPELMIAQNGIFITNNGSANFSEWKLVDNLNVQKPLTRCYKFGFDSIRNLPFIEFPSDIAELIGSGILVSYIVTKGVNGNVTVGTLTNLTSYGDTSKLPSNITDTDISENLVVYNASASTSGSERETIDEAYSNFKKIIGTFDTLITTRDYANATYNLKDAYGNPMVSNASVSDRTDDFNHALNVVSYDEVGQYVDFVPSDEMSVADLTLYPLEPYQKQNYNVYNPSYVYNQSFKPLKNKVTNTTTSSTSGSSNVYTDSAEIVTDLDDLKCIGHSFRDITGDEVCLFKTVAALDVQLFTYAKVNAIEQAEIRNNVLKALSDNFNARELEYGYEIPYDSILDVIYASDSRIKSVSLAEPTYEVKYVTADDIDDIEGMNGIGEPVLNTDVMTKVIAKNVLAGKLELFKYDDRFEWAFGQTDIATYDNIQDITTELKIPVIESSSTTTGGLADYQVAENESLQFIAPSITTKYIYPAGVYYKFESTVGVKGGYNYVLHSQDKLTLHYVDSAGNTVDTQYLAGTIIRPSFDLAPTNAGSSVSYVDGSNIQAIEAGGLISSKVDPDGKINQVKQITVSDFSKESYTKIEKDQQIEIRNKVEVNLDQSGTPIYWVMNNTDNILFPEMGEGEIEQNVLLDSGEYFIYSNPTLDDIVILGSGTSITRKGDNVDRTQWSIPNPVSLESININGLSAFTSGDWQYKQFNDNNYITLEQMQVVTLSEGTTVSISGDVLDASGTASGYIDGDFKAVNGTISYVYGSEPEVVLENPVGGLWNVRTRLDVVCGPDSPQTLYSVSGGKEQKITLRLVGVSEENSPVIYGTETGQDILINYPLDIAGGKNVSMLVTNLLTGTSSYSASLATYVKKSVYVDEVTPIYHEYIPGTRTYPDPMSTINVSLSNNKKVVLPINIEKFNIDEPTQEEIELGLSVGADYTPYATYIVPLLVSLDNNATSSTSIELSSSPNGLLKLFKYNSKSYSNLTTEPSDWETNWMSYFTHSSLYGYEPVESVYNDITGKWEAPDWDTTYKDEEDHYVYYKYDGEEELDEITQSGLYNLEVTAGWQGDYDTYNDLITERPEYVGIYFGDEPSDWPTGYYVKNGNDYIAATTFSAGTYYVKVNTTGDICRVLNSDESDHYAGIYEWDGDSWEYIVNSTPEYYQLIMDVYPGEGVTVSETLNIGQIHKIKGLNEAISSADDEGSVLDAISDMTKNAKNSDGADVTFYYTYEPDNSAVIEVNNMSTAEAFWDANNIVNKFTISQIDLNESNINVARSSQA